MSIEAYVAAKSALEQHEAQIKGAASLLTNVATALVRQPGRMIFSNSGIGLPIEASMSRNSVSFNANDWKSAAELQQMLALWHDLQSRLMNAWSALSASAQANLIPPDRRP